MILKYGTPGSHIFPHPNIIFGPSIQLLSSAYVCSDIKGSRHGFKETCSLVMLLLKMSPGEREENDHLLQHSHTKKDSKLHAHVISSL